MKLRFTLENNRGDRISYIEYEEEYYDGDIPLYEIGEWTNPLSNMDVNSFAYGVIEAFYQSDRFTPSWMYTDIIKVKVEKEE